jgi:hypothetical protein
MLLTTNANPMPMPVGFFRLVIMPLDDSDEQCKNQTKTKQKQNKNQPMNNQKPQKMKPQTPC